MGKETVGRKFSRYDAVNRKNGKRRAIRREKKDEAGKEEGEGGGRKGGDAWSGWLEGRRQWNINGSGRRHFLALLSLGRSGGTRPLGAEAASSITSHSLLPQGHTCSFTVPLRLHLPNPYLSHTPVSFHMRTHTHTHIHMSTHTQSDPYLTHLSTSLTVPSVHHYHHH